MSGLLWLLMLCCAVCGQDFHLGTIDATWNKTLDHHYRTQSIFQLIDHNRVHCIASTGEEGSCMSRRECSRISGSASGNCARNWGVCCVIQRKCGTDTKHNVTYFTNPGYPGVLRERVVECSIIVYKKNAHVCQLRFDFRDVHLAQPNNMGRCHEDSLKIADGSNTAVPLLCGDISGQHVFVDFQPGVIPIKLTIQIGHTSLVSVYRKWNIQITQIEYSNPLRAPPHVLMYFTELEGSVKSFNYNPELSNSPNATRQIGKTNYVVGIRAAPHICGIRWWQDPNDRYSFTVSGDTEAVADLLGNGKIALTGDQCSRDDIIDDVRSHLYGDFIIIPNTNLQKDRFCGNALNPVTTFTRPFTLTVVTGWQQFPYDFGNRGFSLLYRQIPCPSI